jgi:hypothetical protein
LFLNSGPQQRSDGIDAKRFLSDLWCAPMISRRLRPGVPVFMKDPTMRCSLHVVVALGSLLSLAPPVLAETVMQQCGQQYQAAKAAGTLNGMTWNQFRSDCSAKLKAQPASTETPPAAAAAPATPAANPLNPAPATTTATAPAPAATTPATPATTTASAPTGTGKAMSTGRAAFVAREKECGAEWRAQKATLVAQTPGLTWPKYLSQCNTRLKAAGK